MLICFSKRSWYGCIRLVKLVPAVGSRPLLKRCYLQFYKAVYTLLSLVRHFNIQSTNIPFRHNKTRVSSHVVWIEPNYESVLWIKFQA